MATKEPKEKEKFEIQRKNIIKTNATPDYVDKNLFLGYFA